MSQFITQLKMIKLNIQDILLAPKSILYRWLGIPLRPRWLVFMVTDACNSRCIHCNIWKKKPTQNLLTPSEIERIFKEDLFKDVRYVICTGGEVSTREDLKDVFLSLHKALPNATLQLSTNGLLPNRIIELVEFLMKHDINLDIGVSLDGIGDKHDRIRGIKGNFERVNFLLHKLIELREKYRGKLRISVGLVVSDLTIESINDVRKYADKLGIDITEAWYNTSSFYDNCNNNDKAKMKDKMKEIVNSQKPSLIREKWLKWLDGKSIKFPCFALHTFCVIKCNGDVVPCLNLWESKIGNIRQLSPNEVWYGKKAQETRKKIKNCDGCLNNWGAGWSFETSSYQKIIFYLKHPLLFFNKIFKFKN